MLIFVGSPGRGRTDNATGLSRRPLPVGILGYGAGGGSRTLNIQFLKLAPLPIGIPQRGQGSQNRTDDLLAPNQARYLAALHPVVLASSEVLRLETAFSLSSSSLSATS